MLHFRKMNKHLRFVTVQKISKFSSHAFLQSLRNRYMFYFIIMYEIIVRENSYHETVNITNADRVNR